MTDPANDPARSTITIRKSTAIIAAALGAAVLIAALGVAGWAIATRTGPTAVVAESVAPSKKPEPTTSAEPVTPTPTATASPAPARPGLGTPVTLGPVTLTVNSLEVLDQISTVEGDPLIPDPGGELVLFHTSYVNTQNPADLSCGNNDLYIQVFDAQGREMAPIFETYRIPGNRVCNDNLLQGTTAEWNWAVQGVAGALPATMVVTETIKWTSPVTIELR